MDISTLCEKIGLQPEIRARVLAFSDEFDFSGADGLMKDFRCYEKMSDALAGLHLLLGEDPDNVKLLACLLKASADLYEVYKEKGIGDKIYIDTMKCYTRFIDETRKMTGRLYFDRGWWTTRQAGLLLFRIGELEYEMKPLDGDAVVGIHIPSDADFSPPAVDMSLSLAKEFFAGHFPEWSDAEYRCHSWLLDRQLKQMLRNDSNILSFQDRFEIFDEGETDTDFIQWVFNADPEKFDPANYDALPEDTSLRRNLKKYLLSGGVIRSPRGRLKQQDKSI